MKYAIIFILGLCLWGCKEERAVKKETIVDSLHEPSEGDMRIAVYVNANGDKYCEIQRYSTHTLFPDPHSWQPQRYDSHDGCLPQNADFRSVEDAQRFLRNKRHDDSVAVAEEQKSLFHLTEEIPIQE